MNSSDNIVRLIIFCVGLLIGFFISDKIRNVPIVDNDIILIDSIYVREVKVLHNDKVYELYYFNPYGDHVRVVRVDGLDSITNEKIILIEGNKIYIEGCL